MACHFSLYSTGLSNLPESLPEGAMLILNDRIPMAGHDPDCILRQLSQLIEQEKISSLLLDFQRPENGEAADLIGRIIARRPCPVGVTAPYWQEGAALFLPPIPPGVSAEEYLMPKSGGELWLEAALQCQTVTVTPRGAIFEPPAPARDETGLLAEGLCRYTVAQEAESFRFRLFDTRETLCAKLEAAASLGVSKAIGLYQELQKPLC